VLGQGQAGSQGRGQCEQDSSFFHKKAQLINCSSNDKAALVVAR
jgi:hypothetical protein